MKRVIILGSGAREHIIAQKISKNNNVTMTYVCPGNTAMIDNKIDIIDLNPFSDKFVEFCMEEPTIVFPCNEKYLVNDEL